MACWLLKKLKIELPHDPAILLLGIYPKELKAETGTYYCTPMFTEAVFTIAKCRSHAYIHGQTNGYQKLCVVHTYNGIVFRLKKDWSSVTCSITDESWGHHAKWNKPVTKKKHCMVPLLWGSRVVKFVETESSMVVSRRSGRGHGAVVI